MEGGRKSWHRTSRGTVPRSRWPAVVTSSVWYSRRRSHCWERFTYERLRRLEKVRVVCLDELPRFLRDKLVRRECAGLAKGLNERSSRLLLGFSLLAAMGPDGSTLGSWFDPFADQVSWLLGAVLTDR